MRFRLLSADRRTHPIWGGSPGHRDAHSDLQPAPSSWDGRHLTLVSLHHCPHDREPETDPLHVSDAIQLAKGFEEACNVLRRYDGTGVSHLHLRRAVSRAHDHHHLHTPTTK